MTQLFASDNQNTGVSASASVLPMSFQSLFPFRIDWFDILAVPGILKSLLKHHNSKTSVSALSLLYGPALTSIHD